MLTAGPYFAFLKLKIRKMRTLILMRHAHSHWPPNTEDFDRPLSDKGKAEATEKARYLKEHLNLEDALILCSPARRTRETAEILLRDLSGIALQFEDDLYNAEPSVFSQVLHCVPDEYRTVIIISHNNGISYFANSLSDTNISQLPTAGIAVFEIAAERWAEFDKAGKKSLFIA